jgi:protein phosphatase
VGYFIDYIVLCQQGKVRDKNQDNFWCAGYFLESENCGLIAPINNLTENISKPVFAVFDGMGGEKYGELAAYIATKTFNTFYSDNPRSVMKHFLAEACAKMNKDICVYARDNHTGYMGTTVAILAFDEKDIYVCNVGDSKIFRHSAGKLTQITYDHISTISNGRKPTLTQHLGIPTTEFVIEPYLAKSQYADGDRYLICSDGLTDMVTVEEIEKTLSLHHNVSDCANTLMTSALSKGGVDNITIILCDLHKKR